MDERQSILTIDWRKFGDYSAVGQLTKKIFSVDKEFDVFPIQCSEDRVSCNVYSYDGESLTEFFGKRVLHDSVQNWVKNKKKIKAIYVRVSPHLGVLELACKLAAVFENIPLIVHYMDTPHLSELRKSTARYILSMYKFLMSKADCVYTIHESSVSSLECQYQREVKVLSNFFKVEPSMLKIPELKSNKKLQISYFGSIDKKMNASAITDFCRVISGLDWVDFSIWSNSGLWGDVKSIVDSSENIDVRNSSLSEKDFVLKMREADFLFLPYNMDEVSVNFLKHSFSNKFVDYLESGSVVFCLGPEAIPTVSQCLHSNLGIVCQNTAELDSAFASKEVLLSKADGLRQAGYIDNVRALMETKRAAVDEFVNYLRELNDVIFPHNYPDSIDLAVNGEDPILSKQLSFLIRRKYLDKLLNKQSLSATLMARSIRKNGYKGFDYEI